MDRLLLRSPRYSEGSIRSKRGLVRYFGKTLVRWYFEVVLVLKMVVRSGIGVYTPRLSLLKRGGNMRIRLSNILICLDIQIGLVVDIIWSPQLLFSGRLYSWLFLYDN
jgi:hypothetical protein